VPFPKIGQSPKAGNQVKSAILVTKSKTTKPTSFASLLQTSCVKQDHWQ